MMRWWLFIPLAFLVKAKPIDDPFGGAICENTVSAFFVSDNTNVIWDGKILLIENVTEDQCKEVCINNKDLKGRSILCASFIYDHVTFQCNVYRHRSLPDGTMARKYDAGKRYFEKFCLSEDLPVECANTQFIRADESIIKGYAKNTSIVPSMEECASRCMREEFDCKSAMYFYDEGGCITNIESATTRPDDFGHPDDGDRVVYFQNGCTRDVINSIGQDTGKARDPEIEPTTASEIEDTEAATIEGEEVTTETPVEVTEEKPVKSNKASKVRGSSEIGTEEEAPVPDQGESEPKQEEGLHTPDSLEVPAKEEPSSHDHRKTKVGSSERSQKSKKTHESLSEEPEADSEPTTQTPETSTGGFKKMEKDLLDLINESSDAVASLGQDEEEDEKPQPKISKKKTKSGARHKSSDEDAMKEIEEIRAMLKERKAQKELKEEESQEEETTPEPKKKSKSSKKKQLIKEKQEEVEDEKSVEQPPRSEEATEEEQPEDRPRVAFSKAAKKQYGAKQLRPSSDGNLKETSSTEQQSPTSGESSPQLTKERAQEEEREPLPVDEQDQDEIKIMHPERAQKLGLKKDTKKINIKPLKTPRKEHDFTDPAKERAKEDDQEEQEEEATGFFSKWGDWTKCTQPGERRIRRRKCLDLRKCKGALMQVSYCPKEIPAEQAASDSQEEPVLADEEQPRGPERNPLPVSNEGGSSESGHPPGIMPPNMSSKELKQLPIGAPGKQEDVWSPWLGVCQQFASTQPCKNGKVIGFESRECIAKDPKHCKGPFFRYCTLPC